ncbi:RDD family protein [Nocardiopsis sp. CA-288880]|uniref:RDD family protein n=1 Tax=Nocardiopsis sp. CA-288880 TaxID=3239995 RepID=UPI003D97EA62
MQPPYQHAAGQPEPAHPYPGAPQPVWQAPAYPAPPPHHQPHAPGYGHPGYYPPAQNWLPPALNDPGQWNPDNPEVGRAELGVRFVARFVDSFFVGFVWYAMMLLGTGVSVAIGGGDMNGGPGEAAFMVVVVFNFFLLAIVAEWLQVRLWGRSVGKILLGLWVVRSDGSGRVKAGRALVRALLYAPGVNIITLILPWSLPNLLWPLWDKRLRQCLHDKVAGTVVVKVRR